MVKPNELLPKLHAADENVIQAWLIELKRYYGTEEINKISNACIALSHCRGTKKIETGETYLRHSLSTADILAGLRMDHETLIAALLNGCLNQSDLTEADLQESLGPGITRMIIDLDRIRQIANVDSIIAAKDQAEHEENLRRLLLGIAEDVRVVLVVLAERLHLMRAIKNLEITKRAKIAQDTQRIYASLANRLGIWQIKWELEDLSLRYLQPDEYKRIAALLAERREEREHYINAVIETLRDKFAGAGITAEISGRPKHLYSIWRKMQRKNVSLDEVFDLRAVRILVQTVADCYAALGIVHGLWHHIPKEFDDYIATPKGNLYRSLHTAVIGPDEKPLEIQIRTQEMHRHAEFGVAAHWAYKESRGHDAEFQRRVIWMRHWLELKNEGEDAHDFLERFKTEFEPAHIYVLTPQSKVIELPKGATPLDFAYAIHSEIGNRCRGARVNGRIVPLNEPLQSGVKVEILTHKQAAPSRDWLSPHLGYLTTARARNRVRQWLRQQDLEQHIQAGRILLDREFARLRYAEKPRLEELATRLNFKQTEDLLAALGRGELTINQVLRQCNYNNHDLGIAEPPALISPVQLINRPKLSNNEKISTGNEVMVAGVDDLLTQFAACCKPIPPDPIIGFVTRGRGVSIHRHNCNNVHHLPGVDETRLIPVRWVEQPADTAYPVDLLIIAVDRKGLLRDVSAVFADEEIAVTGVNTHSEKSTDTASMRFTVEVRDLEHCTRLLKKLQQIPEVLTTRRVH